MRLPGFTAEASLFKTDESYRLIGDRAGGGGAQAVIPQLTCCFPNALGCVCCYNWPFGPCVPVFGPCTPGCF